MVLRPAYIDFRSYTCGFFFILYFYETILTT